MNHLSKQRIVVLATFFKYCTDVLVTPFKYCTVALANLFKYCTVALANLFKYCTVVLATLFNDERSEKVQRLAAHSIALPVDTKHLHPLFHVLILCDGEYNPRIDGLTLLLNPVYGVEQGAGKR
jgi:hypothetical protein